MLRVWFTWVSREALGMASLEFRCMLLQRLEGWNEQVTTLAN
jgi:hypothetical protein